jgi:adenine phosphoribosyltransferase
MQFDPNKLEENIGTMIPGGDSSRRDFRPVYANPDAMAAVIDALSEPYRGKADLVAAPESLGFILGSAIARELGVGFVAIRSGSHEKLLPESMLSASYIDHRDMPRSLAVSRALIPRQSRVLLVDDFVETAATMQACVAIMEEADAKVIGIAALGANVSARTLGRVESIRLKVLCKTSR